MELEPGVYETASESCKFGQKLQPDTQSCISQTSACVPCLSAPPSTMRVSDALPALDELLHSGASLVSALRSVAASRGVTFSALKAAHHRRTRTSTDGHGNRRLTVEQEQTVVGVAQAFSINNLPLSRQQIREMVARRWGVSVSDPWTRRFLARHRAHLRARTCKALADKRMGAQMLANVDGFCEELTDFLQSHAFTASAVMNFDETRVVVKGGHLATQRVVAAGKERANAASTRRSTVASLLTFAAADGSIFLSVYVLKANFDEDGRSSVNFSLEPATRVSRRSWPRFFCWTDSGFLDADLFGRVMDLVVEEWTVRNPGRALLLFGDQCSAHMRADTLERALARGVYLFFLVANASHFLQPLDAAPFAVFHRHLRIKNDEYVMDAMLSGQSVRDALLAAAYHCERVSFTPAVVKHAFVTTGLWPFNREVVRARAEENLGVADPGSSPREQARAMTGEVLAAARQRDAERRDKAVGGKAVVQRGAIHSPYNLVASARKRSAEMAAEAEEVRARKIARAKKAADKAALVAEALLARQDMVCQVCKVTRHRGGPGWAVCECGHWRACRACKSTFCGKWAMEGHGGTYTVGVPARSR